MYTYVYVYKYFHCGCNRNDETQYLPYINNLIEEVNVYIKENYFLLLSNNENIFFYFFFLHHIYTVVPYNEWYNIKIYIEINIII